MYLKLSGDTDLGDMQQIIRITPQGHGFEKKTRLAGGEFFFKTLSTVCVSQYLPWVPENMFWNPFRGAREDFWARSEPF